MLAICRNTTAGSLLAEVSVDQATAAWQVRNCQGRVLAAQEVLGVGEKVQIDFVRAPTTRLLQAQVSLGTVPSLLRETISCVSRTMLATSLGPWLTDDAIAAGLRETSQLHAGIEVWAEFLLLTAGMQARDPGALPGVALLEGCTFVGACIA